MKKFILTLALIATLSVSLTSCSTDDSGLQQTTSADDVSTGNGDVNLPRPTLPRG